IGAKGRINRDGNPTREQDPGVGNKKRARGRQHEGDTTTGRNTTAREFSGTTMRGAVKIREGKCVHFVPGFGVLGNVQMNALGVVDGAVAENLDQSLCSEDT